MKSQQTINFDDLLPPLSSEEFDALKADNAMFLGWRPGDFSNRVEIIPSDNPEYWYVAAFFGKEVEYTKRPMKSPYVISQAQKLFPDYERLRFLRLPCDPAACNPWSNEHARAASDVYFVAAMSVNMVKIGCTKDVPRRVADLLPHSPVRLTLLGILPGGFEMERAFHERFRKYRAHFEWFHLQGDLAEFVAKTFLGKECEAPE